ncbi:hypothetical protein B0186_10920 [Canicola haemoglobinophilus]|uniref:Uncharacterized protein n=1 Tax=Canicola haemoglobinophilus TaxID=733 RepID=A0A1V4AYH3_9PAST|nr:hypothetical protein [Canicola haemoglobinophilus]OOR96835.1 hypothetical protein B0186_10920 [Canicola haemoglobinophilus]STO59778.1 Uncharacterised protein [Canicola haemoglobinophilus]
MRGSYSSEHLPFISQKDIKSAYANAIPRFQSFGVVGSKIWVKDCYQKSNYKLGCYHFDQLISNIYKSVDAFTLSADAYFSQANVEERAHTYIFELKQLSYTDFQRVVNNTIFQLDQNRSLIDKYWK